MICALSLVEVVFEGILNEDPLTRMGSADTVEKIIACLRKPLNKTGSPAMKSRAKKIVNVST